VFRTNTEKKGEKERVRAALLRAALRLSALHGFASLGLREVSREAGIAPTSFYRHFADMQELGVTMSSELVGEAIAEVCAAVRAGQGPVASVLWDAMFGASLRDPELIRFFVAERSGASASLRASLQHQLARLASELTAASAAETLPAAAADSAVVLLIDVCARALDETEEQRVALRESCVWAVERLLPAPGERSSTAKSGKVTS
jgi:AcrR family transcriptional regulator